LSDQVVLLWQVRWLHETWTLSRALREHDEASRRVFEVCRRAIVGVPGYASWEDAQAMLGYSVRSLRRLSRQERFGKSHWGYFPLQALLALERAYLRTTWSPPPEGVNWWEYVPVLVARDSLATWMAWHDWGRLSLPDLSAWQRRFLASPPVPGKELLSRKETRLSSAEIVRLWTVVPVAVRVLQNETGYLASAALAGPDVARLEWNCFVLDGCRR
jgi:hypothetical protein